MKQVVQGSRWGGAGKTKYTQVSKCENNKIDKKSQSKKGLGVRGWLQW
jgi:hypothetical protein